MVSKIDKSLKEFTIQELIYYTYFALMLFVKGMGLYEGQWPYTLSLVIGAVLILVKLIITEHNIFEWIFIVLLSALSITIYFHSHKLGVLVITATIIGMKKVSVDRLMWIGTIIWSFTFGINIVLTLLGIRPDIIMVQEKLGLGHIIRYSLGSTHPNVLQISYMILCAFVLYVTDFKGKRLIKITLLMLIGSLYIFLYSVSYTGFALCVFYLLLNLYFSSHSKLWLFERISIVLVLPFCVWFVLYMFRNWEWPYMYYVNKILNTRPYIFSIFLESHAPTLFGLGYCDDLPVSINKIDTSYGYMLIHYGYIFFVGFIFVYEAMVCYYVRNNYRKELCIIISSLLAAVTEPFFANESFKNITWLFLGAFCFVVLGKMGGDRIYSPISVYKKINIPIINLSKIGEYVRFVWKKSKYWICSIALIIAALTVSYYMKSVAIKSLYYVNRSILQAETKESIMIDIDELPDDFTGELIKYEGKDVPMVEINSYIGTIEYYRKAISLVLGIVIITLIVGIFIFGIRYEICAKDKR